MRRLPTIIGDAPSEVDFPDFMKKLGEERRRVRRALEEYRAQASAPIKKKASPRAKVKKKKKTKALAKDKSISIDDLQRAIAILKKEKGL
jgi:Sec-independent protein translocase protein TatA